MKKPGQSLKISIITENVVVRKSFRLQLKYPVNSIKQVLQNLALNPGHKPNQLSSNCDRNLSQFSGNCNHDPSHPPRKGGVRRSVAKLYQTCTVLKSPFGGFRGSYLTVRNFVSIMTPFSSI